MVPDFDAYLSEPGMASELSGDSARKNLLGRAPGATPTPHHRQLHKWG